MRTKFILVLLALLMVFTIAGCSGDTEETTSAPAETKEVETTDSTFAPEDKKAFKVYLNEYAVTSFGLKNDEIVTKYIEAVKTGDGDVLLATLREIIVLNAYLYEELEAFEPTSTVVEELHSLFIEAVSKRELAYADIMLVLTDADASKEEINAAFDVLDEGDALFMEFRAKIAELKTLYGLQ